MESNNKFLVEIKQYSIVQQPKPHISFILTVRINDTHWLIRKRFSDFTNLHQQISEKANIVLPKKHYSFFSRSTLDPLLVEDRRKDLENYLKKLLDESKVLNSKIFMDFLEVPTSLRPGYKSASIAKKDDNASTFNSESWLAEFHRLESICLEIIRSQRYDSITISNNKKKYSTVFICFNKLENWLQTEKECLKYITEEEKFRRLDLLSSLKEKKDTANKSIGYWENKNSNTPSNANVVNSEERNELLRFKGNSQNTENSSPESSLKNPRNQRKFGLATETDLTRPLNSEGLLNLQTKIMEEQDQTLEVFSKVLKNQNVIAQAIGEELDLQNELLGEIDNDLGNVTTKFKHLEKKLNKVVK
ncbi:hypothetical protein HDU92_004604 [Lobulomyces angularis]|nr:hypothetical protein HDU92_004604 [Lobulomyces angularis]